MGGRRIIKRGGNRRPTKKFQKPIDKSVQICYNKDTEREVDNYEKQKAAKPNRQGNG